MPQMDSTDPAGIPAGAGRGPRTDPLPVRKPSTEPARTPTEAEPPDEAQRAHVARALRATRRAASSTTDASVPPARPSGAGSTPPSPSRTAEEGEPSSSRRPRTPIIATIAGVVVLAGAALLLPGLGDDPGTPASSAGRENSRAGSTPLEVTPSGGRAGNDATSAEEDREDGDTGEVSADGAKKDPGERGGAADSGTRTPADTGEAVADADRPGGKVAPHPTAVTVAGRMLTGQQSGKCLSAGGAGAPLTIRTCDGSAGQRWEFRPDGTVRSQGLCMDLVGASKDNGTAIGVASCTGAATQQFHLNATDDLVARFAAKCVDVYDRQSADGTRAILWPCTGAPNQTWTRR